MFWWRALPWLVLFPLAALAQTAEDANIIRSGTRLVEVDVVVRNKPQRPSDVSLLKWMFDSGPPFGPPGTVHGGLTKDDFILLDNGTPQEFAVFQAGTAHTSQFVLPLRPGETSNRITEGQGRQNATAVLVDFLNSRFGCRGYERTGMLKYIRSLGESEDSVALFTLGVRLHVVHDFGDNLTKLSDAALALERSDNVLPSNLAEALYDLGDVMNAVSGAEAQAATVHGPVTIKAVEQIIQHFSGVTGRKNLIWVMDNPRLVPPATVLMARQANIKLYPVQVRLVRGGFGPDTACGTGTTVSAIDLAAVTGATPFFDVQDLRSAVNTAEEDSTDSYVLGYYPSEKMLDGRYHKITVKLRAAAMAYETLEVYARPGYAATKVDKPPPPPTLPEMFANLLDATAIGLTGEALPSSGHAGLYDVRVRVDARDLQLAHGPTGFTGAIDFSFLSPSKQSISTSTISLDLTEEQFPQVMTQGLEFSLQAVEALSGLVRVVVRDRTTGNAGSLKIPVHP